MRVTANFFKRSGKWYMDQTFDVPGDMDTYNIRLWIEANRPYKDEFIMVITDLESIELIGYPMMDHPTGEESV